MNKPEAQRGNIQNAPAVRQTANALTAADVDIFLKSGWIFGLESGRFLVGWGEARRWKTPPLGVCAVFAPDFYMTDSEPWWTTSFWTVIERGSLQMLLQDWRARSATKNSQTQSQTSSQIKTQAGDLQIEWQEPSRDEFAAVFAHLQNAFTQDASQSVTATKAVPVVFARGEAAIHPTRIAMTLVNALETHAPLRLYGLWNEREGMLGLTPEVLFRFETSNDGSPTVKTMALAGTRRGAVSDDEACAFLEDPKERHEHQIVIDDLKSVLSAWGRVETGTTKVLRLPTLSHLHTPMALHLDRTVGFEDIARTLHPTPALGVAPRRLGLEWMRTWDKAGARGRFGAPFGAVVETADGLIAECLVAIRNIQWQSDSSQESQSLRHRVQLGSGCGLVPQSDLESEWRELGAKRDSVRRLLGI